MGQALSAAVVQDDLVNESQPADMQTTLNNNASSSARSETPGSRPQTPGGAASPLNASTGATPVPGRAVPMSPHTPPGRPPTAADAAAAGGGGDASFSGTPGHSVVIVSPSGATPPPRPRPVAHCSRHDQSLMVRSEKTYIEFVELLQHMGHRPMVAWLERQLAEKPQPPAHVDYPFVSGRTLVALLEPQRGKTLVGDADTQWLRGRVRRRTYEEEVADNAKPREWLVPQPPPPGRR